MLRETSLTFVWKCMVTVAVLACSYSGLPIATAQTNLQGQDAAYNSSMQVANSPSFIDASMFVFSGSTLCSTIYKILLGPPTYSAAVIDARGLNSGNTNMKCAPGTTPWNNGTTFQNKPSTILLPAGTIVIQTTWVLPNYTRLIGEGDAIASSGSTPGTTIQACMTPCSFTGSDMIDLGNSILCPAFGGIAICNSVSVEHLTLDGQGQSINGIVNTNAQTGSSVDHVGLYRILGTGLSVTGQANDSGPYSNITFDLGGFSGTQQTVCANINGQAGTRGIHGLNCISENNDPPAAVLLDSSNNSIEDVRIVGFYDGIRVGANNNAQSNVLLNIIGDTNPILGGNTPIVVVHIFNVGNTVSDLSIMGANNATGGSSQTITIQDDLTGPQLKDTSVGIYALGESAGGGHSRFTTSTSTNVAHWTVGTSAQTGTGCAQGSLYSCTNAFGGGTSGCGSNALYVCGPSGWIGIE